MASDLAQQTLQSAQERGMALAWHAARQPHRMALVTRFGDRTWAELNARVNRLARLLRAHGIGVGDAVAVVTRNRPEFVELHQAAQRIGARFTPVNFHLLGEEAGYVIDDCEAKAVVFAADVPQAEAALAAAPRCTLRLAVGGAIAGCQDYEGAIAPHAPGDIDDPVRGSQMLYTSGTTGRPKGVYRKPGPLPPPTPSAQAARFDPERDLCLCTGPAYHAAPLGFNVVSPLNAGVGVVLMDKWDPEETLALIERYRITHTHMVATMFHRIMSLPDAVRGRYDVSSLRFVLHGAAPTPVHLKQRVIAWLGPIVYEYYAATEGGAGFFIDSPTWLAHPGSVGRTPTPELMRILDEQGADVAQGEVGFIYFKAPAGNRFEYFKAQEKTAQSYRGDWFTLGDMGYLDADGYLYLTGRSAETIISGGVNIYPQEVDNELLKHAAVQDVCTIGAPNEEWGEEVRSVVQLKPGLAPSPALVDELLAFARAHLAAYKCPRGIDFDDALPRMPSGKIQRGAVRARYWQGRARGI